MIRLCFDMRNNSLAFHAAQGGQALHGRRLLWGRSRRPLPWGPHETEPPKASPPSGRTDISQDSINYTVGGSQHVAMNVTLAANRLDLDSITQALEDSVTSAAFVQRLNAGGTPSADLSQVCDRKAIVVFVV